VIAVPDDAPPPPAAGAGDGGDGDDGGDSLLFTYVTPFLGVLLVAIGIGGAVPGGYALVQEDLRDCDTPTVLVEPPERAAALAGDDGPRLERLAFADLSGAEQSAFVEALDAPRREAHVDGAFPNRPAFENGTLIDYRGDTYYATVVAENTCFRAPALGFPLGLFAIGLGTVALLVPPAYRRLVALEREASDRDGETGRS
jgi:hypothetical protein